MLRSTLHRGDEEDLNTFCAFLSDKQLSNGTQVTFMRHAGAVGRLPLGVELPDCAYAPSCLRLPVACSRGYTQRALYC